MIASRSSNRPRSSRGFTLMESVIVILVLAVAGTAIVALQGKLFSNQGTVKDMQVGSRLMLECAEHILATRRFSQTGMAVINSTNFTTNKCANGVAAQTGYTIPTATVTDPYTGAACPTGYSCKTVTITQGGLANITLMLVEYGT